MIFSIQPKIEELPFVLKRIEQEYLENQSHYSAQAVILCCEELISNIIFYSHAPGDSQIVVSLEEEQEQLVVTIKDSGAAYNPLEQSVPDLELDLDQREIGGLGIHLVKQISNAQCYRFLAQQNILTLKFNRNKS